MVILTAPLNESTVNAYRQHSQNSCSYLLPLPGVEPESSGEHVSPVTTPTSSRASLSELNVTVHVVSASTRPTGQLSWGGGGGSLGESPIGRLVLAVETACTCWTLIACQLHDGSLCCLSADYVKSPFLTGRMFVRPNILRTLRRTMIRFLTELLVRRIWFGQSKFDFILNWLVMRCKLRPELAADAQQTA